MQLHDIKRPIGAKKRRRIVGRGRASGWGKTSGRGENGQGSRAGRGIIKVLEGGQVPLIRRLSKVGFNPARPKVYQVVKLSDLAQFKAGSVVDASSLKEAKVIKSVFKRYKVLGNGELKNALTVKAYGFSKTAEEQIKKAGGKAEVFDRKALKKALEEKETPKSKE